MSTRRDFLKLGALWAPAAVVAPRVAYSFLWPSAQTIDYGPGFEVAGQTETHWTIRDMSGRVLYQGPTPATLILNAYVVCAVRYGKPR